MKEPEMFGWKTFKVILLYIKSVGLEIEPCEKSGSLNIVRVVFVCVGLPVVSRCRL